MGYIIIQEAWKYYVVCRSARHSQNASADLGTFMQRKPHLVPQGNIGIRGPSQYAYSVSNLALLENSPI